MEIQLQNCRLKSIRADLVGRIVRIVLETPLSEKLLLAEGLLQSLAIQDQPANVTITEQQEHLNLRVFGLVPHEADAGQEIDRQRARPV